MIYSVLWGGASIHFRHESKKPFLLRLIAIEEIIGVILASYVIVLMSHRNVVVRNSKEVWGIITESIYDRVDEPVHTVLTDHLESIEEEKYEFVWTTEAVNYRKGPGKSYKSAGKLEKDKFIKVTGVTYGGWDRISIDGKDYYIPGGKTSSAVPEDLPIWDGEKGEYQKYALSLLADYGWDDSELVPLIYLWDRESRWSPTAHNSSSGAHGIPQSLPASKMASEGDDYYYNPETQIRWGLGYISGRYGSPSNAWAHSQSTGWY